MAPQVHALVLAAGRSARMGGSNKLLAKLAGVPMICRVVDTLLAAGVTQVTVVTGNADADLRAALSGRAVAFVHNSEFESGLASSLRTGVAALASGCDGALVCLGDMPCVRAGHIGALLAAFEAAGGQDVCVPVHAGQRGNPVLWPARCFPALQALHGDTGGRTLLAGEAQRTRSVAVDDDGVLLDADTPEALSELVRRFG